MIRKIILENYMSHIRTVIEPAAGLTVLIGPNNCGKSAVAHALEMICYNPDGAGFAIRHGAKKAVVTVETEDDAGNPHTLVWERKKETVKYIIDGREISGIGRGNIPDDLHRHLKMPEIAAATGKSFRINFGSQKQPIFLLDEPASRAAQFFASSSDADRLMDMQRRHKQKESEAKRKKEEFDSEIARLDRQLADLSPLEEIASRLARVETQQAEILSEEKRIGEMSNCVSAIDRAWKDRQWLLFRSRSFARLQPLPRLEELQPVRILIEEISSATRVAETSRAKLVSLRDLSAAPALADTRQLSELVANLDLARRREKYESERVQTTGPLRAVPAQQDAEAFSAVIARLRDLSAELLRQRAEWAAMSGLTQPPAVEDPTLLRQKIAEIASATKKRCYWETRHLRLTELPAAPSESDTGPLAVLLERFEKLTADVLAARNALRAAEAQCEDLQDQIRRWVRANPRCQSCGQAVSAELVMTGGHDHD